MVNSKKVLRGTKTKIFPNFGDTPINYSKYHLFTTKNFDIAFKNFDFIRHWSKYIKRQREIVADQCLYNR